MDKQHVDAVINFLLRLACQVSSPAKSVSIVCTIPTYVCAVCTVSTVCTVCTECDVCIVCTV